MTTLTEDDLMLVPKSERTQNQWDAMHDIWLGHMTWCVCPLCRDVEEYLNELNVGRRGRG